MLQHVSKKIVDLHIWIALAASALVFQTSLFVNYSFDNAFYFLVFGGTLSCYQFLNGYPFIAISDLKNKKGESFLFILGLTVFAISCYVLGAEFAVLMLIPGFLILIYILPIIPNLKLRKENSKKIYNSGRSYGWFKLFLIALVWTIVTYLLPLYAEVQANFQGSVLLVGFAERFLFIIGITIPFDIRDQSKDPVDMQTIPQRLGKEKSLIIACLILAVSLIPLYYSALLLHAPIIVIWATGLSTIITIIIVYLSKYSNNKYYYTGIIDGCMILPSFLSMMGKWI